MFARALAELLARVDRAGDSDSAREQLLRLSRVVLDFTVQDPARQQLLVTRSFPGFTRRRSRTRWPSNWSIGPASC